MASIDRLPFLRSGRYNFKHSDRAWIMDYRNYITIEANKRGGKPCVRGLRITVYEVLEYLASEMTEAEILDDFPDLTREDLKACIGYAADRERRFTPSQAKKIFEPDSAEELLRGWLLHSHKGRQRHDRAARRLDSARVWLGAIATAFAVIVSTSIFAALEKDSSGIWKVILPVISILSAILGGLSTFLNLAERSDKHRSAGVQYKAMIRELERKLSEEITDLTITSSVLDGIQKRLDELEKSAPIVPEKLFLLVDKDWNLHGVEKISKADDLYNAKNQPVNIKGCISSFFRGN
jgi:uncharacterized protein (DUF433 family)